MDLKDLAFLTSKEKESLEKLKLKSFEEILYYFPFRFLEAPKVLTIKDVQEGDNVCISGIITHIEAKTGYYKGLKYTKAIIKDETESINVFWWNMPYVAKSLSIEQKVILSGSIHKKNNELILVNPKIEKVKKLEINNDNSLFRDEEKKDFFTPIYGENKFVKQFQIKRIINKCLQSNQFKSLEEIIPDHISKKLNLPTRKNAIIRRHLPKDKNDILVSNKYFAFEEIFIMQIYRQKEKLLRENEHSYKININKDFKKEYEKILPFKLTNGQEKVMETILKDISSDKPMSRLVEGDVGSGKTILALIATFATINTIHKNKKALQVAYIAPTEILANQHFEFFIKTLKKVSSLGIALLTRSGGKIWPSKINKEEWTNAPKTRIKKLLNEGKLNIVIGTHSLFNKNILFEYLGLIIIDEQHRFGVNQRKALLDNHKNQKEILPIPHLLSMSATPIPRTLALTIYGDLDLSILDELPPGRKRADTILLKNLEREKVYQKMEELLRSGRQGYIITPKIALDENLGNQKSSISYEEKRIKERFPKYKIGILHGKLSKNQKEEVMEDFYSGKVQILISTTVVEVGVSVSNATFILIENADTFGLAQLHQLRGRVERSTMHSYCFLLTESENENSLKRLAALVKSNNGFELAEVDLSERGPGSLIGKRQSGLSDIGMEAIKNRKLVEIAKEEAGNLLKNDLELQNYPLLKKIIDDFSLHIE